MSLVPGARLGPYEILAPLGRGGMGVVFKARDLRLQRFVAIKVLPEHLVQDPVASARFEREARAVAALNHPGILALHDVGREASIAYVVTELLEGEPLRSRLLQGPLPVRQACEIARQVAQGLAAAHDKGVVHRDLKPENLWLLPDGRVKILDFGIAKRVGGATGDGSEGMPTLDLGSGDATAEGVLLGSVGYMSPEQLRGGALDGRSDLFSLGVVLWEMVAGRNPFRGDSALDTASAVLRSDPPPLDPGLGIPPLLERILEHCLRKDARQRFQTARDLEFALGAVVAGSGTAPTLPKVPRFATELRRWARPAGALGLLLLAGALGWRLHPASARPSFQRLTFEEGAVHAARFARDGETVILSARWTGEPLGVFLARAGSAEARSLGAEGHDLLAISSRDRIALLSEPRAAPDNPHVRLGRLEVVGLTGGTPQPIADDVLAADWFPDGERLVVLRRVDGRYRIESPPGVLLLSTPDRWSSLRVSPDGRWIAAFRFPSPIASEARLEVMDVETREERTLVPWLVTLGGLAWHPSGREIWYTTFADPAGDLHAVTLEGRSRIVADVPDDILLQDSAADGRILLSYGLERCGVLTRPAPTAPFERLTRFKWGIVESMAGDGSRILTCEDPLELSLEPLRTLYGPDGRSTRLNLGRAEEVRFSHDGRALISATREGDTWVLEIHPAHVAAGRKYPLGPARSVSPVALLEDRLLALREGDDGRLTLLRHALDGGNWTELLTVPGPGPLDGFVDPAARSLALGNGALGYRVLSLGGGTGPIPVRGLLAGERVLGWTSDGRALWVARSGPPPLEIWRLELADGVRSLAQRVELAGHEGDRLDLPLLAEDGRRLVFNLCESRSSLQLVRGLR